MKTKYLLVVKIVFVIALLPLRSVCQCITPFEAGSWINRDPNTRGITHLKVDFSCNDVVSCGVDTNGNVHCTPPPPPYTVHLWGACSPSDCDWGAVAGHDYTSADGTRWIYAFYDQGFARRYVYLKKSSLYPGHLYMWMYTDFTDPHRPDYVMKNWFRH